MDRKEEILKRISELDGKRKNIESLQARSKVVIDEIESRFLNYIRNSKSITSLSLASALLESITVLYKLNLDSNTQLIRSIEKEIELIAKHAPDEDGNLGGINLSQEQLLDLYLNVKNKVTGQAAPAEEEEDE